MKFSVAGTWKNNIHPLILIKAPLFVFMHGDKVGETKGQQGCEGN